MKLLIQTPAKVLNKAYLKQNVQQDKIQGFQDNIHKLFERLNPNESEENQKNLVCDFLKDSYYKDRFEINTSGREDLAIHRGKTAKDAVGVIIENKRIDSPEMMSHTRPNVKALHELILYYFVEREVKKNIEISHLIATDLHNWYVFDENDFRKIFYENTAFKKIYQTKIQQNKDNGFFYTEIKKLIETLTDLELPCAYFSFDKTKRSDAAQIALYKLLSPEHLLKLPFENDANSLNREFYNELLYIIGLEEVKDGGKKIIQRKTPQNRQEGSLLENAINEIEVDNALFNLDNLNQYGQNQEEQLFNVGLELCITWLNRILFLKLLEGQLIKYHQGNQSYAFLNENRVKDFDELSELFFEVLAVPTSLRKPSVTERYGNIPYLNSSLFELTELERKAVKIKDLKDRLGVPIYAQSVLKGDKGKRKQGEMSTVKYLFEFLDAYDFASDSSAQIQEQAKTIINASVLGLIFEKINGYRDGSFFTPGFITMYMCRETLRKAVLEKFRPIFPDKNIDTFDDLKKYLNVIDDVKRKQYNEIVNSVRVCDPAVGSGHFLVSALNELIAIKHDLEILSHRDGSMVRYYKITIENDELIVLDEKHDELFEYRLNAVNKPIEHLQKLQETLFHEKETIIENCLFGVDINPNSVKICRLRLWIELLKNAYYVAGERETGEKEKGGKNTDKNSSLPPNSLPPDRLQTLPNIDINIKTGNSLVARFGLEEDLSEVFKKQKFSVKDYKQSVYDYKNSPTKERKAEVLRFIDDIKNQFVQTVYKRDPLRQKLNGLRGQLLLLKTQNTDLFGNNIKEDADIETIRLEKLITQREAELENAVNSPIHRNAFEWRFEFPEVLDEEGKFVGFDAVVGNPPYVSGRDLSSDHKAFYKKEYPLTTGKFDLYLLFIEKAISILKEEKNLSFIIPNTILANENALLVRNKLSETKLIESIVVLDATVFDEASVETVILRLLSSKNRRDFTVFQKDFTYLQNISFEEVLKEKVSKILIGRSDEYMSLNAKIDSMSIKLGEISDVCIGIQIGGSGSGSDKKEDFLSDSKIDDSYKKVIDGKDFEKYLTKWNGNYIRYGDWLHRKRDERYFLNPKIVIRQIGTTPVSQLDLDNYYALNTVYNLIIIDGKYDISFVYGVINSSLVKMYWNKNLGDGKTLFPKIKKTQIVEIPIPNVEQSEQQPIIHLVEKILSLKAKNPQADTQVFEDEIDELVFGLYGLSAEERAVVLGG